MKENNTYQLVKIINDALEELKALDTAFRDAYIRAHYDFEAAYDSAVAEYVESVNELVDVVSAFNQEDVGPFLEKLMARYGDVLYAYERVVRGPDPDLVAAYQEPLMAYLAAASAFYGW